MKKIWTGLMSAILLVGLVGCSTTTSVKSTSATSTSGESTLQKVKKQGYVTVGFANEKPYAYATPDGKLTGEAVEVARAVLKKIGINEMNGVLTDFGSLIPGLKANRFDMITAGMYITPPRAQQVAFANPEYSIGETIAVKKGNPLNLHSYDDIKKNPKLKIGVMGGAAEYDYLIKAGVAKDQIQIAPDNPSLLAALQAGRADAITMTGPSLQTMLDTSKPTDIERVMDFRQPVIDGKSVRSYGATVFRPEDKEFHDQFNKGLKELKDSGELLKILSKFNFTKEELPGNMTTEDVLKNQK